jgi:hypothetical protein
VRWYVSRGGQTEGPFEEAEVAARYARRELDQAYVASDGSDQWILIEQVPVFARARAAPVARKPLPQNPENVMPSTQALDGAAIAAAIASQAGQTPPPISGPAYGVSPYGGMPQRGPSPYAGATPAPGYGAAPPGLSPHGGYTPPPQPAYGYSPHGGGYVASSPMHAYAQQQPFAVEPKKGNKGLLIGGGCGALAIALLCVGGIGLYFLYPRELTADVQARMGTGPHATEVEYVVHTDEHMDVIVETLWDGAGTPQTLRGETDARGDLTMRHAMTETNAWLRATVRIEDPDHDDRTLSRTVELDLPPRLRSSPEGLDCVARARCTIRWGEGDTLAINGTPGVVVSSGAANATIPPVGAGMENGSTSLALDVGLAQGDMTQLYTADAPLTVTFPVNVTVPGNTTPIAGTITRTGPVVRERIVAFLGRVVSGPLVVEGTGTGRSVAYLPFGGEGNLIYGASAPPASLSDIAYVAIADWTYTTVGECPYEGVQTGRVRYVRQSKADALVRLYDRRTGRMMAERRFEGHRPACPDRIEAGRDVVFGAPSDALILLWVRLNAEG